MSHWMEYHSLSPVPPTFKFKKITSHGDPLTRQLMEATIIRGKGTLNRKTEYALNELIRLETTKYTWEQDQEEFHNGVMRNKFEDNMLNFITVMKNVASVKTGLDTNPVNCFRIKRQSEQSTLLDHFQPREIKLKKMETSTPVHSSWRAQAWDISPSDQSDSTVDSKNDSMCNGTVLMEEEKQNPPTQVSGDMSEIVLTPAKQ